MKNPKVTQVISIGNFIHYIYNHGKYAVIFEKIIGNKNIKLIYSFAHKSILALEDDKIGLAEINYIYMNMLTKAIKAFKHSEPEYVNCVRKLKTKIIVNDETAVNLIKIKIKK